MAPFVCEECDYVWRAGCGEVIVQNNRRRLPLPRRPLVAIMSAHVSTFFAARQRNKWDSAPAFEALMKGVVAA